jgi:carboxylesterase
MVFSIVVALLVLVFCWSALLWGYRDVYTEPISPNVDQVFDPKCLPIILEHDPPAKKAIVMVHGYPSTPYSFEYAAHRAFEQGYDVYVPLLPGFGTSPKDLYRTSFTQWYEYLETYYLDLRTAYDHLFVVGTSMGGAMTLRIGERFSDTENAPDAMATVAAPVFLNDISLGVIQKWGYYLMRLVGLFTPAIGPKIHRGGDKQNDGEELWMGYGGAFVRGGVSFMHALKGIRRDLDKITVPLIAMHALGDKTIAFQNLGVIQSAVRSNPFVARTVTMDSNHNQHVLLMYPSVQAQLTDELLAFFETNTKETPSR